MEHEATPRASIEWDRKRLNSFKRAYGQATQAGLSQFEWNGHEFVTGYAKYLIEYLEGRLIQ